MALRTWGEEEAEQLAEWAGIAYAGYGEDAGWLTFDGRPMPQWGNLPDETREHWIAGIKRLVYESIKAFLAPGSSQ